MLSKAFLAFSAIDTFIESPTRKLVNVVGVFRSGTNLLKTVLEEHFKVKVVFSKWSWKHGLPTTRYIGREHFSPPVPVIVISKDPIALNESLYNFWQRRRPELNVGKNISEFIQREFIVYDSSSGSRAPHYIFNTPTDYWNQFHYAYANWPDIQDRLTFLRYEDLVSDTDATLSRLAETAQLRRRLPGPISLPKRAIMPSKDFRGSSMGEIFVRKETILLEDDIRFIRERMHPAVTKRLGYSKAL